MPLFLLVWLFASAVYAQERTVVDELGYSFTVKAFPKRVVSLAPEITEMIFAGGCGNRLVAASEYSDFPEAARKLPQVGSYARPDIEKIASYAPDLVIGSASGNPERSIARLRELGLNVYVIFPRDVKGALDSFRSVSELLGCGEHGFRLANALDARFESCKALPVEKSPEAIILFNLDPPISSGADTLSDDLLSWAGLSNILHDSSIRYPTISLEWIVSEDPEFIFLAIQSGDNNASAAFFDRFPNMQAVRKKQVIVVDPDLVSRAGPRLVQGAIVLREALVKARGKMP